MNEQTKQDILAWAQTQVDSWAEYQEDWWGSYNDEWDINIWDSSRLGDGEPEGICVTAYRIVKRDGGEPTTDIGDWVRVGCFEVKV